MNRSPSKPLKTQNSVEYGRAFAALENGTLVPWSVYNNSTSDYDKTIFPKNYMSVVVPKKCSESIRRQSQWNYGYRQSSSHNSMSIRDFIEPKAATSIGLAFEVEPRSFNIKRWQR